MKNVVYLLGHLGQDPELKQVNGKAVVNFSMATNEKWKDKEGEQQEKVTWHRVVVWGRVADNCAKYLSTGSQVFVEGKIDNRSYEKDGEKKYISEVVAHSVQFLSGKKEEGGPQDVDDQDSIPF
jgi:single-strand DNA-binding protein